MKELEKKGKGREFMNYNLTNGRWGNGVDKDNLDDAVAKDKGNEKRMRIKNTDQEKKGGGGNAAS